MSCPYGREELSAYVDAEVDAAAAASIHEHLRACSECRREVASLKLLARMVGALPRLEPDTAVTWNAERAAPRTPTALHCPVVLPDASALIDGEVSEEEAQAVVGHLAGCDPCHRAYKDLERISEALAATEPVPVPAGLEARILSAIEAESRFSLRRWLRGTCEACTPAAHVAFRFAAAAVFVALLALGVIYSLAPDGVSLETVLAPSATVAVAPLAPTAAAPAAPERSGDARPAGPPREPVTRVPAGPGRPPQAPDRRPPVVDGVRPPSLASDAPTVARPPGGAPAPVSPPTPAPEPHRDLAPVGTMMASRPPSHPAPPSESGSPGTSRPLPIPALAAPGPEPPARPLPPPVRIAERSPADGSDADRHVRVRRSGTSETAAAPSRGIDPASLRAAEARLTETIRAVSRSQPKSFRINP